MNIGPLDKRTNLVLLVSAFAMGQGSLFISQTILLTRGQIELLGYFGISLTLVVLAYQVVDLGGLVTLARRAIASEDEHELCKAFWSLTAVRLVFSLFIAAGAFAIGFANPTNFYGGFSLACAPALIVGAFNAGGILDGRHRSGLTGLTSAIPLAATAFALAGVGDGAPFQAGVTVGATYSIAAAIGVIAQHVLLAQTGHRLKLSVPNLANVSRLSREGALYLLAWTPGQLFYRGQLSITGALLGPVAMGHLVYAKQIINGVNQLLYFIRRTEFPELVKLLSSNTFEVCAVLKTQKAGLGSSILLALLAAGLAPLLAIFLNAPKESAEILLAFCPTIVTACAFATTQQILFASDRTHQATRLSLVAVGVGLPATWLAVTQIGIFGLPLVELLMQTVACGLGAIPIFLDRRRLRAT